MRVVHATQTKTQAAARLPEAMAGSARPARRLAKKTRPGSGGARPSAEELRPETWPDADPPRIIPKQASPLQAGNGDIPVPTGDIHAPAGIIPVVGQIVPVSGGIIALTMGIIPAITNIIPAVACITLGSAGMMPAGTGVMFAAAGMMFARTEEAWPAGQRLRISTRMAPGRSGMAPILGQVMATSAGMVLEGRRDADGPR
jgi:hypothetical protein